MRTEPFKTKRTSVDPKYPEALALQKSGRHQEAILEFNRILCRRPDDVDVLLSAAGSFIAMENAGFSIQLCERAVQLAPDMLEAWNNLGAAYRKEHLRERAIQAFSKANELDPKDPTILNNLSASFINEGDPRPGVDFARKGLEFEPDNNSLHWNLSLALLEQGDFKEAWPHYEHGLELGDRAKRSHNLPQWQGEEGKRVVVYGEQGLGDEIMFMQFLPEVIKRSEKVFVECHPRLVRLFKRAFPECGIFGTRKDPKIHWLKEGQADFSIACGSLPLVLGDFPKKPYLSADPKTIKLAKPLIGIHWFGGHKKTRRDLRSIPLMDFLPILRNKATFISLQYTPEADNEVEHFVRSTALELHHWPEIVRAYDYYHTASLVSALDLVITVNTSLVHLCGSIGQPETWVLTPQAAAWRYGLEGERMPTWGDNIRQIRERGNGWREVMREVSQELEQWIQKNA